MWFLAFLTGNCNIIVHVVTQMFFFYFRSANLLVLFFSIVTLVVHLKTVVSDKRSRDEQPSVALLTFRMITEDEKDFF